MKSNKPVKKAKKTAAPKVKMTKVAAVDAPAARWLK